MSSKLQTPYRREQCKLILEMLGGFDDFVENLLSLFISNHPRITTTSTYINDVLALVTLFVIRTRTPRYLANRYVVNVPCRSRHGDFLLRNIGCAATHPVKDKHSAVKHKHSMKRNE